MERNMRLGVILGVGIVGGLVLAGAAGSASAITYQNSVKQEFTFNPTINVSLSSSDLTISNLSPGGTAESNIITATVSTNAGYGYYLSATTGTAGGSTSLVNSADSTYSFTNLSSNAATLSAIPDDKWGYSYSIDNGATWVSGDNGSALTGYNGLPLDADDSGATGVKLLSSDSFATSGSVKFKIGARASSSQAAGIYTGTVNFYAVTNPAPEPPTQSSCSSSPMLSTVVSGINYMQDINSGNSATVLSALTAGDTYQIKDNRDNETYCVGKLADGKLWLLDNLALDLTSPTILNGMNESNTNASNTILGYLKNGGGTTSDKYAITGVANWTDSPSYASSNSYSDPLVNLTNKDVIPTDATSTAGSYKIGGYYNYCAASAGSYCYGNGTSEGTSSDNATEDICPKGWRMPTGNTSGEYSALANAIYGYTGSTSDATAYANYRSALHLPLSGVFDSGSAHNQESNGFFWSSTRYDNSSMYSLILGTSDIYLPIFSYARYLGISVRCVLGS